MKNGPWINVLAGLCFLASVSSRRCYMKGSNLNDRVYTLSVDRKVQRLLCEGKSFFRPETCSCFERPDAMYCDKRPLAYDGTTFEQLDSGGVWRNLTCPSPTIFIREVCRCDFGINIPRVRGNADCYIEETDRKSTYKLVINNVEKLERCPDGQVYEAGSCACVMINPACDKKEDPKAMNKFLQVDNGRWTTHTCAPGTVYRSGLCRCDF